MYDLIEAVISHDWQSNYTSDQQYIYYIAGAIICLFFVVVVDMFYKFISSIIDKIR